MDQIAMLQVEAQERLGAAARLVAMRAVGALLLLTGWLCVVAALAVALSDRVPPENLLFGVAAGHAVLGVLLLTLAPRARPRAKESS